jgi:hypothetical protein
MRVQRLAALKASNLRRRRLLHFATPQVVAAATADTTHGPGVPVTAGAGLGTGALYTSSASSSARLLLTALALGLVADFLFYAKSLGVSVPIFVSTFLVALLILPRLQGVRAIHANLWLLVPTLFFAVMTFVRANATLTLLNLAATILLLSLMVFFYAAGRVERLGLLGYPAVAALVGTGAIIKGGESARGVGKAVRRRGWRFGVAVPVLRGIVVALPILFVFAGLLAAADTVFQRFLSDFFNLRIIEDLPETLSHLFFILVVAWLVAGGLLIAISRGDAHQLTAAHAQLPGVLRQQSLLGFVEGATILGLVNLLFAVFAWIQFSNIFFGQPTGMPFEEYRNYVRRGFGELLVVCVLTIGLILSVRLFARTNTPRQALILKGLSTVMVVLTFVMLVSAYMRMDAWEAVQFYINTQVRIYVRAFIVWLGIVFGWLAFTMWFRRDRFAVGAFLAALGFLATINMANPDADVAAYNLKRNDELSIRYLDLLSEDAVPVLVKGFEQTNDIVIHNSLGNHLAQRLAAMEEDPNLQNWQSFHLARSEAYHLLKDLEQAGKLNPIVGPTP